MLNLLSSAVFPEGLRAVQVGLGATVAPAAIMTLATAFKTAYASPAAYPTLTRAAAGGASYASFGILYLPPGVGALMQTAGRPGPGVIATSIPLNDQGGNLGVPDQAILPLIHNLFRQTDGGVTTAKSFPGISDIPTPTTLDNTVTGFIQNQGTHSIILQATPYARLVFFLAPANSAGPTAVDVFRAGYLSFVALSPASTQVQPFPAGSFPGAIGQVGQALTLAQLDAILGFVYQANGALTPNNLGGITTVAASALTGPAVRLFLGAVGWTSAQVSFRGSDVLVPSLDGHFYVPAYTAIQAVYGAGAIGAQTALPSVTL